MKIKIFRAKLEDKEFILHANLEIDRCSFIENTSFAKYIEKDLFKNKKAVCLLARDGQKNVGMILFSRVYWADRGEGIYVSQVFVEEEYRQQGIFRLLLKRALNYYKNTNFITCLVSNKNQTMLKSINKLTFEDEGMVSFAKNKSELCDLL